MTIKLHYIEFYVDKSHSSILHLTTNIYALTKINKEKKTKEKKWKSSEAAMSMPLAKLS